MRFISHLPFTKILFNTLLILGLCVLTNSGLYSQSDHYGFAKIPLIKSYSTDDYDGGIQNWDFSQDERGYLYVANNFGLLEFDGSTWNNYEVDNNTRVRSVFADIDGRIYIGGQNQFGYFKSEENGVLRFHSLYDSLPQEDRNLEDIWRILKHDDQIIFSSYLGSVTYDGNTVKRIPNDQTFGILFKVASTLYAQTLDNDIVTVHGGKIQGLLNKNAELENEVRGIIPFNNNSLLIFQKNGGIHRFYNNQLENWLPEISQFLKSALVNEVLLLQNKNIAIGTQNNGIIIITQDGKILHHINKDKGLDNRTILSLHEDAFNNLWIGLNNGISKLELASPFSIINSESGLPGTGYSALLQDNRLYLGTSNGLFYQNANQNPISEPSGYEMIKNSGGQVYNVQNINGSILLAHHDGAFEVSDDVANEIYNDFGVWKFHPIPGSSQIIGGTYRGFTSFERKNGELIPKEILGFEESSRVFEFIDDTTLFMTHGYKGVFKVSFDAVYKKIQRVQFYGKEKGLPSNLLINVFRIDGDQLIFAAETGIYSFNKAQDRFEHFEKLEKHLGEEVHLTAIAQDLTGNIYFVNNEEVGYLELTPQGDFIKQSKIFSRVDAYISDDLENINVIDHENVLFGGKEGFIHYNPSNTFRNDQLFSTYIRSIKTSSVSDVILYGGSGNLDALEVNLPANFTSLKFKYASPYFNNEDKLQYQYQLENFDKQWSEWSSLTEKEYTNLSEGTYTFRVRALNSFGAISEESSFSFSVYPPWFRSKIAYTIYGLLFFLVFGAYMFFLDRKFRRERKSLTIKQQRELLKKDHEIVEVSKKSEQEITKLRNDKLRSEIDHKNRELATTTMHLINKNEFMLRIRDVLKETASAGNKDQFKRIIKDIDRNLSEDEGWDQFTKHFDQVHGEFLTNIKKENPDLTPQEIKLCAYLRMNMSSKEIANLLNISVRGVEIGRYRLRKKLGISRETNLVDYMLEYS